MRAHHHPLSLRYRRPALTVPLSRGRFCLACPSASGCAPDRAPSFLCVPKEKKAKERAPWLAGRPRADCSVVLGLCGSRPTHYASFARCVQTGGAKSVNEARCARTPKALRSSTAHKGPKSNAVVASQLPNQHLAAHRRHVFRSQQMFGASLWHGVDQPNPCGRSGTTKWRAPLLWLLSNESDSPAGATTRRRRTSQAEATTRSGHQWLPACAGMTSTQETPHV